MFVITKKQPLLRLKSKFMSNREVIWTKIVPCLNDKLLIQQIHISLFFYRRNVIKNANVIRNIWQLFVSLETHCTFKTKIIYATFTIISEELYVYKMRFPENLVRWSVIQLLLDTSVFNGKQVKFILYWVLKFCVYCFVI